MGDKRKHHYHDQSINHVGHRALVAGDLERKRHHHHRQPVVGIGDLRKPAAVLIILILAVLFPIILAGSLAGGLGWGMGPGMMGNMMGGARVAPSAGRIEVVSAAVDWSSVPWVLLGAFIAGAGLLGWLAVARARSRDKRVNTAETPLEIAQNRYVLGEISLAEYEEMLQVLLENQGPVKAKAGRPTGERALR